MSYCRTITSVALILILASGCASVPDVEQRLRHIGFEPGIYVVRPADTVPSIAFRYRMTPAELTKLNPGVTAGLHPGMRLDIQLDEPYATRESSTGRSATVTPDDAAKVRPAALYTGAYEPPGDYEPRAVPMPTEPRNVARPEPLPTARVTPDRQAAASVRATAVTPQRAVQKSWPREEIVSEPFDEATARSDTDLLSDATTAVSSNRWWWPTDGQIARGFQPDRVGGQGVDIAGAPGQDVRAAMDGRVVYSGRDLSGVGNLIILQHPDNLLSTYSHTNDLYVAEDDEVRAGDPIASLGANERQESVLGFEIRRDGNPLNPLDFLPSPPVR